MALELGKTYRPSNGHGNVLPRMIRKFLPKGKLEYSIEVDRKTHLFWCRQSTFERWMRRYDIY